MPGNIREEIAEITRRLYRRGLTTVSGGNISAIGGYGSIFITRSGPDKGMLTGEDICEISSGGDILSAGLNPSMETGMHLAIYRRRPDTGAIIHSHPTVACAFSATDREIDTTLTGETYLLLGKIEKVPGETMGSEALAEVVGKAAVSSDVIMIGNHGPVCLGRSLMEAYNRTEVLEQAARMTLAAHMLGNCSGLSAEALRHIDSIFRGS
jgi:L-fuculose-phosphate aldolase